MKKHLLHIGAVFLMVLFVLPAFAEAPIQQGYYRIRNSKYPTHRIGLANDYFSFQNLIGSATTAASHQDSKASQAGAWLRNDVHVYDESDDLISPATVIYVMPQSTGTTNKNYNLIAQGTSFRTLATGNFTGTSSGRWNFDNWLIVEKVSGYDNKFTAKVSLSAATISITRYFRDSIMTNGTPIFYICETPHEDAYWEPEPITYFNVTPEIEYNGKYYTTLKVPFKWQIANGSSVEKIYVITDATNGILQHQEITGEVPEGTSVILECGSNDPHDCKLTPLGVPKFPAASTNNQTAPKADQTDYYVNAGYTNLLVGTYICNTDGKIPFLNTNGGTSYYNGDHYTTATDPQKYVLGIGESGNLGFISVPATTKMPANKAWLEYQAEFTSVAIPTISLPAGTYYEFPQTTSISCATQGAVIHYTTDGTTPTENSPIYSEPLTLNQTTTVKAIAVLNGQKSAIAVANYVIEVAPPTFSPVAGTYNNTQNVTISCATPGAVIYYTGPANSPADPTTSSTLYTGPIAVNKTNMTIKAIAVVDGRKSTVASAKYVIQVQKPTVSLAAGTYVGPQTVTASCATEGATIRYTTDGTTPSGSSPIFPSEGITVDRNMTLIVKAFKTNWSASAVNKIAYTITNVTADPTSLTINDSGTNNTFNVYGYTLNLSTGGWWSTAHNEVDLTNSNSSFSTTLSATTGTASTSYFNPTDGTVAGTVAMSYNGRKLKDECTITLTYRARTSISATVNVTYVPDIYIVTDNGVQDQWNFSQGTQMTNNNGVYTATFTAPVDNTFILFARKLGESNPWDTRYVFGPNSNGDWVMPFGPTATGTIDVNDDDPIKLPYAGEYTITINANDNTYPFTITRTIETVATPTISPAAGTYTSAQSVTISCTTPGAEIHYTTDGSTPTADSPVYSAAIPVNSSMTIKAIAMRYGWYNSSEASATYTILPTTPTTLAALVQTGGGVVGNNYAITDQLIGAWSSGDMLWAKDYNSYSGYQVNDTRPAKTAEQVDYARTHQMHHNTYTWTLQEGEWDESNWVALDFSNITGKSASDYVGKKISGIKGTYADAVNYKLTLTEVSDPITDQSLEGLYPDPTNYGFMPVYIGYGWGFNSYLPANFYTSNQNKEVNGEVVGFKTDSINGEKSFNLYFMNPKIQEVARIWGAWNGSAFAGYTNQGYNDYNPYIDGVVSANWQYNSAGVPTLIKDTPYVFHAVIFKKTGSKAGNRAPYPDPETSTNTPSADYEIYPLDLDGDRNITAVEELSVLRTVKEVTYYNVMGQQSSRPFDGINIVVTRYTDGTISTMKVLR